MFKLKIEDASPLPKYRQIIDQVKLAIATGHLRPGDRLPNQAQMKDEYGVFVATASRAYRELAQEGLIYSRRRKGTFVMETTPQKSVAERKQLLMERTKVYLVDVAPLGFSMSEIIANIRLNFKREDVK